MLLNVRGHRQVIARLGKLEKKIARKILSQSARMAMRPILAAAKSNAPRDSGALARSIRMRAMKRNRRGRIGVRVMTSQEWFKGDQYYGAFQEFGWKAGKRLAGYRRKSNAVADTRRQIEGKHYVQKAYESRGETALRTFVATVADRITKEA